MGNSNQVRLDDRYVYSFSGQAYARTAPRDRNHVRERRLPYVKKVMRRGRAYYYFTGPDRAVLNRLPDVGAIDFDNAYLNQLALLEGEDGPQFVASVRSHVYFIGCGTAVKIGIAKDVGKRLAGIQTHCPFLVSVLAICEGGRKQEREYHRRFAAHRLHGEWFSPTPEILAEIDRLNSHTSPATNPQRTGKGA